MKYFEMKAYAKVNLTLDVVGKRDDGYHELCSIMHAIDICDEVRVERANDISMACSVPLPPDNTAVRAAREYSSRFGGGAHITIRKRIPSEAGLGGASADAAAVLLCMRALYGAASDDELYGMGLRVGADVPFCLMGGCALARGIGEVLTPLPRQSLWLALVKGERGISTRALFSSLRLPVAHPDTGSALKAAKERDALSLCAHMENALEPAAAALLPEIADYKRRLLFLGASGACMSGSGSTVVGAFLSEAAAREAVSSFSDAEFACVAATV